MRNISFAAEHWITRIRSARIPVLLTDAFCCSISRVQFRNRSTLPEVILALLLFAGPVANSAENWPQFRGPNSSGVSEKAKPPVNIGPSTNVLWQVEVPWSPSSPAIWSDRIFLATFDNGELQTRCYNRITGKLLWSQGIKPEKLESFHNSEGSPAASTPATDGRRIVSYFGSIGFVCYDFKGKELWRHPLPVADSGGGFGTGTSPTISGDYVVLNRDQNQGSYLLALDLATGKERWRTARPEARGSFGTAIVWNHDGKQEVITPGSLRLQSYDLKSGHERWLAEPLPPFSCTTPVLGDGLLFFAGWSPGKADSPFPSWKSFLERSDKNKDGEVTFDELPESDRGFAKGMDTNHDGKLTKEDWDLLQAHLAKAENILLAVKPGGTGDISSSHIAWRFNRGLPYVPSPIFYDGRIYLLRDGGMLSSLDAKTGKSFYLQERIGAIGSYYASPVAADDRIYVVSVPGKLSVIKAGGDKPEILHQADFKERAFATPALVGNNLYVRTEKHLWAF